MFTATPTDIAERCEWSPGRVMSHRSIPPREGPPPRRPVRHPLHGQPLRPHRRERHRPRTRNGRRPQGKRHPLLPRNADQPAICDLRKLLHGSPLLPSRLRHLGAPRRRPYSRPLRHQLGHDAGADSAVKGIALSWIIAWSAFFVEYHELRIIPWVYFPREYCVIN